MSCNAGQVYRACGMRDRRAGLTPVTFAVGQHEPMTETGQGALSRKGWLVAQRALAIVVGAGFVVVGVMRFMPLESLPGWGRAEPLHGLLHLATGALWFAAGTLQSGRHAGRANRWLGGFWLATGVAGNAGWLNRVEALSFDDNAVHLIVGVAAVSVGWSAVLAGGFAAGGLGRRR